jgi:hypothetical protein
MKPSTLVPTKTDTVIVASSFSHSLSLVAQFVIKNSKADGRGMGKTRHQSFD